MLNYTKLWRLLESKGMKKTDLTKNKIISPATLAKLGKNETITSDTIDKLCDYLICQPSDIMEHIREEDMRETAKQLDNLNRTIMQELQSRGVTEEQFATMMSELMPEMVKNIFHGGNTMENVYDNVIEKHLPKEE